MSSETAQRDPNRITALLAVTNDSNKFLTELRVDPTTLRLLIDARISNYGLPTGPITGQAVIASTGTAVQLGSNLLTQGVIISAKTGNAAAITIGGLGVTNTVDGTGNGVIVPAGASLSYAGTNTNQLYVNGTSGDIISFIGS